MLGWVIQVATYDQDSRWALAFKDLKICGAIHKVVRLVGRHLKIVAYGPEA